MQDYTGSRPCGLCHLATLNMLFFPLKKFHALDATVKLLLFFNSFTVGCYAELNPINYI